VIRQRGDDAYLREATWTAKPKARRVPQLLKSMALGPDDKPDFRQVDAADPPGRLPEREMLDRLDQGKTLTA
jgi:hypothetical protein